MTRVSSERLGYMHPRVAKLYLEFMMLAPALTCRRENTRAPEATAAAAAAGGVGVARLAHALVSTSAYRAMVQEGFAAPPHVKPGTPEFARRLARGRWALRQLQDIIVVKKYRAMHKRYDWSNEKSTEELVGSFGEAKAREIMMGFGNRDVYGYNEPVDGDDEASVPPGRGSGCL
ncbi:hypothetical protein DQ04_00011240 [Trypanosoma grayi]|uniref:hypothetical protein n=1 Tax=Trypanosoma grayi TaxID=71804 RepID=UPI0004F4AB33|nr:hypothetical protein DQ04_00011240 [Trypanosoma grayi]KEG15657.1 hypothetical protein DQ04_00011240 [Trypanosoma grayi]